MSILQKIYNSIFSTTAAGLYLLVFAAAIGIATFIENDYGTSSAQELIFRARWFELLLILFGGTILANIFRFRMVPQKKWASLIFHSAIIIIILGAGITRYFGYEGMMHIREGQASQQFLSAENYLNFKVSTGGKSYSFSEPVYFSTLGNNKFKESYQIGTHIFDVNVTDFIPNPTEQLTNQSGGKAVMKVVIAGKSGREEFFVSQGDKVNINGINFNFTDTNLPGAFNVKLVQDSLYFATDVTVTQMVMATQTTDTIPPSDYRPLRLRSMYVVNGQAGFVVGDFKPAAVVNVAAGDPKMKNESLAALKINISHNGQAQELLVTGRKGTEGKPATIQFGDSQISVSYGAKVIPVPFQIQLRDFIMDKYPGTNNPSSYASEVTVIDPGNGVNMPFRIYMNNILDYGGYRFFQSSFDQDEAGTYLSVNHDFWGTWVSYIGYILLTVGMAMTFFSKNSRFSSLLKRMSEQQGAKPTVFVIGLSLFLGNQLSAQNLASNVSQDDATAFGKMIVQDHNGRFKPVNTLSSEVLRKLAKKSTISGLSSDQIFISMMMDPAKWENVPLIHIGAHPEVARLLGTTEKLVSYRQFFTDDAQYKLRDQIRNAQSVNPKDQGTFEKAIIKVDEKINIANMVFSGRLLRLFPVPGDALNTWISPADIREMKLPDPKTLQAFENFASYIQALEKTNGNTSETSNYLNQISAIQQEVSGSILPSNTKINAEIWLNKMNVFGRLRNIYGLLSLVFLATFFVSVFSSRFNVTKFTNLAFYLLLLIFAFHTLGLGLRWYVSGRAPWSNGYESMIYISWTTMLAGLIFSRKSLGGMAATLVLAATILLVAGMSWLDPEITPLVPVLKSYWLTIHVSLEAGSYGFLMLGAVIGMLNLILMVCTTENNLDRNERVIKDLTVISEITLLGGLFMVSVGTYLGGVWANESWGRYWGWDAKETWALVTILVYAFILHMRFIPGLRSLFAFNFASLFGFATVIMTYFGVNYYLSGLHSYAAGDPVPVPPQVYYTAIALGVLSIAAFIRWRLVKK
jgi:cytochrome c-type biogenesis protein CcsB